jgi:hypothetical protein
MYEPPPLFYQTPQACAGKDKLPAYGMNSKITLPKASTLWQYTVLRVLGL